MALLAHYLRWLAVWAGGLFAVFTGLGLISPDPGRSALAGLPVWGGLALVLAAYPAGLAVSADALPDTRFGSRNALAVTGAAVVIGVVTLVLAAFVAPVVERAVHDPRSDDVADSAAAMSIGALRREMMAAVEDVRSRLGDGPSLEWQRPNQLAWLYYRRIESMVLPLLFTWLGVLTGFWARRLPRRDLTLAVQWAMGLFLVMSTYLVGENSYELLVLRSAGPMFFAADLVLVVPGLLAAGLAAPAVTLLLPGAARTAA